LWERRFGSLEEAARAMREAVAADPDDPTLMERAAQHCFRLGQAELAVRYAGAAIAATNPTLKIVVVMHMDRPGIVKPFVNGLKTLDETAGVPGSYPLISDQANVNQIAATTSSATAKAGVEALVVEFGAFDRAVLDVLFAKNPMAGWTYGQARLPMELPSSDEAVSAQYEDLPADSWAPTYALGSGSNLANN